MTISIFIAHTEQAVSEAGEAASGAAGAEGAEEGKEEVRVKLIHRKLYKF